MTEAQELAARVNELRPNTKSGSLKFFGEWFGGRRDNWHVITAASASKDELVVRFDGGEKLAVAQPRGAKIDSETFRIADASRVRWEWFSYGLPMTPENLYFLEYEQTSTGITVLDTVDWFVPIHHPVASAPAVLID